MWETRNLYRKGEKATCEFSDEMVIETSYEF